MIKPNRRESLQLLAASIASMSMHSWAMPVLGMPTDDPAEHLKIPWTSRFNWRNVVDITRFSGVDWTEKFKAAQIAVKANGVEGGVVYFPSGTYVFTEHLKLNDGIVIRGMTPSVITAASNSRYEPSTVLQFPKYKHIAEHNGTAIDTAFKGIYLANPGDGGFTGLVNLAIDCGHIRLSEDDNHKCKGHRIVFGCVVRNAAIADPAIPKLDAGQHKWQRFTNRHHAAISVVGENVLIANNRIPKSGERNFTYDGYIVPDRDGKSMTLDGVVFDYDNRPGIYVNHYCIGGPGGTGDDGTPESHPFGFRKGIVIRDNYVFNSGRTAIGFAGDGVLCVKNITRMDADIWRPTVTGANVTRGSSTNDNRAVEMRGWRWTLDGNDFEVYRNWAADRKYRINDGEGLMHEDHCNSTIKDSRLTNNHGNAYISIYKCGEIDGLFIEGNDITVDRGAAIMVVADRNSGRHAIRNVMIAKNKTKGGGIRVAGMPAVDVTVKGNTHLGGPGSITNEANAKMEGNQGYS